MLRFILGLVSGIVVGAVAVFAFVTLGSSNSPLVNSSAVAPGGGVVHVTVAASYLNQELNTLLAAQPGFADAKPQLVLRSPNVAALTANLPVDLNGTTLTVRPTVTMQFLVQNGEIKTNVTSIGLGVISVPASLVKPQIDQMESALESSANRALTNALAGSGLKLYNVSTSPAALTMDLGQ
ncbi:MAG TPA: hypothetical protein VGK81_14205 [Anaerolineae bacterium]|jgi:uncharacterized protein YpmS